MTRKLEGIDENGIARVPLVSDRDSKTASNPIRGKHQRGEAIDHESTDRRYNSIYEP
jgi:hypothetical protein